MPCSAQWSILSFFRSHLAQVCSFSVQLLSQLSSRMMAVIQKNSFLEEETYQDHAGALSRSRSDPSFCRQSNSSSCIRYYYCIDIRLWKSSCSSIDRSAQLMHNEGIAPWSARTRQTSNLSLDEANRYDPDHPTKEHIKMHTPSKRPARRQRARFNEYVEEQKAELAENPDGFDIESIELPPRLSRGARGVEKSLQQLKRALYEFKHMVINAPKR